MPGQRWDAAFDGREPNVCGRCAADEFLARQVHEAAVWPACDYCGTSDPDGNPIAAPVSVLLESVARAIHNYWTDPVDELSYDGREGGYQGETFDTWELLNGQIGIGWRWPPSLTEDVVKSLDNDLWCKRDYGMLHPDERLVYGWRHFEHVTKHKSRFACLLPPVEREEFPHPDDIPASDMLDEVVGCIRASGLIAPFPLGTALVRARDHRASITLRDGAHLGAPSPEQAGHPNRMSAAGIAVFYSAFDERTALLETFDPNDRDRTVVTIGRFRTTRALNVLNLCDLPPNPSYFDLDRSPSRHSLRFLHEFAATVSRATVKDGREHIDYVPTQIFAEFVRHRLRLPSGAPVHGIVYESSRLPGGRCCVLFCDKSACVPSAGPGSAGAEQWLALDESSVRRIENEECHALLAASESRGNAVEGAHSSPGGLFPGTPVGS